MECSRCGKKTDNEYGESVVALKLSIELRDVTLSMQELFKSSMGKYYGDGKQEYEWNFCYECWLDFLIKG